MGILANKKIIVTGATSGIGQAIAARCAEEGADVAFCAHVNTARRRREGHRSRRPARLLQTDRPARHGGTRQFAHEAIAALGGVDGLVNNAGANMWHGVAPSTFEESTTASA